MRGHMPAQIVLAVLAEAQKQFGTAKTPTEREQQAAWVKRRVKELTSTPAEVKPFVPAGFDAKAAAAGDK